MVDEPQKIWAENLNGIQKYILLPCLLHKKF